MHAHVCPTILVTPQVTFLYLFYLFRIYLNMLLTAQTIWDWIVWWTVNNQLKRKWKQSWPNLRHYPGICLEYWSQQSVLQQRCEVGISWIQDTSVTASAILPLTQHDFLQCKGYSTDGHSNEVSNDNFKDLAKMGTVWSSM